MRMIVKETRLSDVPIDRRREKRHGAEGEVTLAGPDLPGVLRARLLDVSASGFRAAHACADLACGLDLAFQHSRGKGHARVMWNRAVNGRWETGFLVLDKV